MPSDLGSAGILGGHGPWPTSNHGSVWCRSSLWRQCGWYRTVASSATWSVKEVQPQLDRRGLVGITLWRAWSRHVLG